MAKTFRQQGDILTLTLATAITSGTAVLVGKIFGVAQGSYEANEAGEYATTGVHTLAANGSDTAAIGAPLYWDATNARLTSTATSNTRVGVVTEAKAAGVTSAVIKVDAVIV